MSENHPSNVAALLEESSEEVLRDLLRAELAAGRPPEDAQTALRTVVLGLLRQSFPAFSRPSELQAVTDVLLPMLLAHDPTRERMERLLGSLLKETRGIA